MARMGVNRLIAGCSWFRHAGRYPIVAYSEFMPPPRLGCKPYGFIDPLFISNREPWGWPVTEYEEMLGLQPGLANIAQQVVGALIQLGRGQRAHGIPKSLLEGNVYWPEELEQHAGRLAHERYVTLLPLAISRTQDDKGRVRWTLFGNSEQGPARGFWRGFFAGARRELPREQGLGFLRRLLHSVYGEPLTHLEDLSRAGLRVLPMGPDEAFPFWREDPLPSWTVPLLLRDDSPIAGVRFLLTFRPFVRLPAAVKDAYLKGRLHLLPFPGSLLFWGAVPYRRLQQELPMAIQIPLLHQVGRHEGWHSIRVPQSGWLHEERAGQSGPQAHHYPLRNTFKRTHRWARVLRHEDELALTEREDKMMHVLCSALPEDVGLYGKPMARNAQIWSHDHRRVLDGPSASRDDLERAMDVMLEGGVFGYRFQYPPMRVGGYEVYWHRPLTAYHDARGDQISLLDDGPLGYLTAYDVRKPDLSAPIELWPRLLNRELHRPALELFDPAEHAVPRRTCLNLRHLLDCRQMFDRRPLPRSFARALLMVPKADTLDAWLDTLPTHAIDVERGRRLVEGLRHELEPASKSAPEPLTYQRTARRGFEVAYWNTIDFLAAEKYLTKNNADVVHDPATHKHLKHHHRDLDTLGDYLLQYYAKIVAKAGMTHRVLVGDLPFEWRTDFDYPWMGGWLGNQKAELRERNLIMVIPGRNRRRAIVMADHYDTAYMEDRFYPSRHGDGARLAAAGADDNHSATAALMLGAPIFLELSRTGRLACDIWLVHLTGEEFPADCMGARHLCQWLVERSLRVRLAEGRFRDLSATRVEGVYVLDMIAHNHDHDRDVFQIAPGTGPQSLWLAYQAHLANEAWNAGTVEWNRRPARRHCGRGRRRTKGSAVPDIARHPVLSGEVRLPEEPKSTLFNTDGQIFSDAGVPVVLFMENYDINRTGYHDSFDTLANIDLDYGAAVAAVAIESVARAATEKPPRDLFPCE